MGKPKITWPIQHTVKKTDTLANISERYYGIPTLTNFIYDFSTNKKDHPNPNDLTDNKLLLVPEPPVEWVNLITTLKENSSNFQVFGGYRGSDQAAANAPYLLPPLVAPTTFGSDITVRLAGIHVGTNTAAKIENDDFRFAFTTDAKLGVLADITIKNNNVWKAAKAAQDALRKNFVAFCAAVESLEFNDKVIISGGTALVAQAIAESMPLSLTAASFYTSGFNDGYGVDKNPYVDLRPGMRLRIEPAANQFDKPGSSFNVPVGTGQIIYNIVRTRDQRIAFDAFMGAMNTPTIAKSSGVARTAAGLIDLQTPDSVRRYFRLVYPTQMNPATAAGDSTLERSIMLIGADTLADLNNATDTFIKNCQTIREASYIVFQGRVSVVVEIGVYVTHGLTSQAVPTPVFVPLGTTVRQIFEQLLPFANPINLHSKSLIRLSRFYVGADGIPQHRPVVFKPDLATENTFSVFDVPLAKGDRVEIRLEEKPTALPN